MAPKIAKVAEGAYFVQSYSEQTIVRSYDSGTTVQSLGPSDVGEPKRSDRRKKDDMRDQFNEERP